MISGAMLQQPGALPYFSFLKQSITPRTKPPLAIQQLIYIFLPALELTLFVADESTSFIQD